MAHTEAGRHSLSIRTLAAALVVVFTLALAGTSVAATPPSFTNYAAPAGLGTDAGEPSVGVNWNTNKVLYQAGLQTLRVDFSTTPPNDLRTPRTSRMAVTQSAPANADAPSRGCPPGRTLR